MSYCPHIALSLLPVWLLEEMPAQSPVLWPGLESAWGPGKWAVPP